MPLTVLSLAHPFAKVSPDAVGRAEQVLSMLDEALVRAGHRSLVVACKASECWGQLLPLPYAEEEALASDARRTQRVACRAALRAILGRERVDVVHLHGVDFDEYVSEARVPTLVTVHLPRSHYSAGAFTRFPRRFLSVFVSEAQRRTGRLPGSSVVVPNGVRVGRFQFSADKSDVAVALGRITPENGFHHALDACRAAGVALTIAGKIFACREHLAYFDREIRPRLDDEHRFIGPVGGERRAELLRSARCVIVPSTVAETSSLVAMEAAASGTPVVALGVGALPEVVRHGHTGIVVGEPEALADAIRDARHISPLACRRHAEVEFSSDVMCRRYLELFESLAGRSSVDGLGL